MTDCFVGFNFLKLSEAKEFFKKVKRLREKGSTYPSKKSNICINANNERKVFLKIFFCNFLNKLKNAKFFTQLKKDSSHENKPMHRMRHMITDLIKKSSSTSETHRHVNKNVESSKSTPLVNVTNTTTPDKIESSIMDATETIDLNASKSCPNVKKRKSVFDALDNRNENESNEKRKLLPNSYDSNKKGPKVNFDKELFIKMENFARKPNSNTFKTVNNSSISNECKTTDQDTNTNVSNGQVLSANKNEAEPSLKRHKATNNNLVSPLKPEKPSHRQGHRRRPCRIKMKCNLNQTISRNRRHHHRHHRQCCRSTQKRSNLYHRRSHRLYYQKLPIV